MPTIKSVTPETSPEGYRLVKVVFTPQVPNPARQCDVEVVFNIMKLEAGHLATTPYAVFLVSSTRMDTRVIYPLSNEQSKAASEAALIRVAEDDDDGSW